jgi:hypothetical protein
MTPFARATAWQTKDEARKLGDRIYRINRIEGSEKKLLF